MSESEKLIEVYKILQSITSDYVENEDMTFEVAAGFVLRLFKIQREIIKLLSNRE